MKSVPEPGSCSNWAMAALAADIITIEPSSRPHTMQSWAGKYSDALTGMARPQSSWRLNNTYAHARSLIEFVQQVRGVKYGILHLSAKNIIKLLKRELNSSFDE